MNDLQKFKAALAIIQDSKWLCGIFMADSQQEGFIAVINRVEGAMNDLPNGTPQEIVDLAEVAVRASLGMS